jgi:hypothetical protein
MFMAHLSVELITLDSEISTLTDLDLSWSIKPPGLASASASASTRRKSMLMPDELVLDDDVLCDLDADLSRSDAGTPIKGASASASSLQVAEEASIMINRVISESESKLASISASNTSDRDHSIHTDDGLAQGRAQTQWTAAMNWIMTNDPSAFANELTKLHWELFSTIRVSALLLHCGRNRLLTSVSLGMFCVTIWVKRVIRP